MPVSPGVLTFDLEPELGPAMPGRGQGEGGTVDGVGGKGEILHAPPAAPSARGHDGVSGLSAVQVVDAARPLAAGIARHRHGLQQVIHG